MLTGLALVAFGVVMLSWRLEGLLIRVEALEAELRNGDEQ
jgi:hypothetical protein